MNDEGRGTTIPWATILVPRYQPLIVNNQLSIVNYFPTGFSP